MAFPRLFLVAPDLAPDRLLACLEAACAAGDVASLLIPPALAPAITRPAQALGVAVLTTGDPRTVARNGCDGIHVEGDREACSEARASVGSSRIVGALCGTSRHLAMELAEAGADYIAFSQESRARGGEPIVRWWSDMFEIPCVAFDPVEADELDTLLPQNPDFIRPSDAMWSSPEEARRIISALMAQRPE